MKILLVSSLILLAILYPTPVAAGGGLISLDVSWEGRILNPGEQYIVRPTVYTDNSYSNYCNKCVIKIKLEDPKPSDYIAQSFETTDENGTMYAKVISYVPGNRAVYAEVVMPDGSTYTSSKSILNYTEKVYSEPKVETAPLSAPVVLPVENSSSTPMPTVEPKKGVIVEERVVAEPSDVDLREKINRLEQQLEESNEKQNALERKLNEILEWFNKTFPFFN